ncbi:5-formyltetrahydrofolate cyclo-ligase [Candidatus Cyrtobacter comes]|uniref:5-formyltetrahydrofolate cyclo-ligase n=1 Tax=Candidatus Cyrtobacter comes TaxID=675776 RepID=A0ABU5L8A0_9RICK|nr:5-formyltetrahydrofolate cyclo-ligase [Candidatus Cyrtobacter comes]MDZ5762356.1 5-formyltetrahydrofolate cyclo-ligase [Candidatus Cyrtobacter comes]
MIQKQAIRDYKLRERRALNAVVRNSLSSIIAENALLFIKNFGLTSVAGYYPINGEVDILYMLKQLYTEGYEISLPVIDSDDRLKFRFWDAVNLTEGKYGIMEPSKNFQITVPDIILTPLVAFDRCCNRIGYGKGYYDRFFFNSNSYKKIGIAYSFQEVASINIEEYDAKMDCIITENSIVIR